MENHYVHLFRVIFMLHSFVLFFSFTEVKSAPLSDVSTVNIIEVMRNDTNLCEMSKFLYDSEYTKLCASVAYPTVPWDFSSKTLNSSLCLGVYDTAYKICQYLNSSLLEISLNTTVFNSYVKNFVSNGENEERQFCNNLTGLKSLYNKTDLLWRPLVTNLNVPNKCLKICFDFNDKVRPLCAVLAWIKTIDDNIKKANRPETKYEPMASNKPPPSQSNDEIGSDSKKAISTGTQKILEPNKEQSTKQIITNFKDNNVGGINMSGNVPSGNVKSDAEKTKFITEKPGETKKNQEKKSNTSLETQTHKLKHPLSGENNIDTKPNAEVIKNTNNGPQDPPINNVAGNVPNINMHEDNAEEPNKKQENDDLKTSTISENTQDHYDAGNPDEDMETNIGDNIDDVDDTIQQPLELGNQNENVQEVIEQKNNLRYPNIRTEDDSHFFTYFTVITVACIAGYIGYHNKQKILAIVLEGRRSRSNRGRRRPSTASYRKLDCTLEEAVTSQCNANVTHVIY